jgi:hypothetical protein
VVGVVVLI